MASKRKRSPAGKPSARKRAVRAAEAEQTHELERGHETPEQSAMAATHVERENADVDWIRPSALDAPPPRSGYVQRWKRIELDGTPDTRNWQRALREGWKPRPADSLPSSFDAFVGDVAGLKGVVSAEGLVLCEMPERAAGQRRQHYRQRTARQMQAVNEDLLKTQTPGGPAIQSDHRSRAETGRRPQVAADGN